jgi:hypothetical protein
LVSKTQESTDGKKGEDGRTGKSQKEKRILKREKKMEMETKAIPNEGWEK